MQDIVGISNLTAALTGYVQNQSKFGLYNWLTIIVAIIPSVVAIIVVLLSHKKEIEKELRLKAFELKCKKLLKLYENAVDLYFWSPQAYIDDDNGRKIHISNIFKFKDQVNHCIVYNESNLCDDAIKMADFLWEWHRVDLKTFGFNDEERMKLVNNSNEADKYFRFFCDKIKMICHLGDYVISDIKYKDSKTNN